MLCLKPNAQCPHTQVRRWVRRKAQEPRNASVAVTSFPAELLVLPAPIRVEGLRKHTRCAQWSAGYNCLCSSWLWSNKASKKALQSLRVQSSQSLKAPLTLLTTMAPIHKACKKGDLDKVKNLLAKDSSGSLQNAKDKVT